MTDPTDTPQTPHGPPQPSYKEKKARGMRWLQQQEEDLEDIAGDKLYERYRGDCPAEWMPSLRTFQRWIAEEIRRRHPVFDEANVDNSKHTHYHHCVFKKWLSSGLKK